MLGLTMQCVIQLQFSAKKQKPLKKELLLDLYSYHTQGQAHGQFLGIGSTLFCWGPALGNLRNNFFFFYAHGADCYASPWEKCLELIFFIAGMLLDTMKRTILILPGF